MLKENALRMNETIKIFDYEVYFLNLFFMRNISVIQVE